MGWVGWCGEQHGRSGFGCYIAFRLVVFHKECLHCCRALAAVLVDVYISVAHSGWCVGCPELAGLDRWMKNWRTMRRWRSDIGGDSSHAVRCCLFAGMLPFDS